MTEQTPLKKSTTIHLSNSVLSAARAAAAADRRTLSALFEIAMEDYLRGRGTLPERDDINKKHNLERRKP